MAEFLEASIGRVFGKDNRLYLMGLAMIWIVFFHISFWYEEAGIGTAPWWIKIFAEGQLGVDIFFFLSAYGLAASIEKNSIMKFYMNRVKRLFPVYILFLLVLFLTFARDCPVKLMFLQSIYQITGISLIKYAHFFSTGFCFDWFTPAIIFIYLFFPIISAVIKKIQNHGLFAELFLIAFLVIVGHWIHVNKHFPFALLAYRLPIIALGAMSYNHLAKNEVQRVLKLYLAGIVIAFVCNEKAIILSLIIPSVLTVFSMTRFELPMRGFVCLVGRYSYEVYLGHIFFVAFFIPMGYVTNVLLITLITLVGTTVVSTFFSLSQHYFYKIRL